MGPLNETSMVYTLMDIRITLHIVCVVVSPYKQQLVLYSHRPGSCRAASGAWWSERTRSRWRQTAQPPPAEAECLSFGQASRTPAAFWSDPV